MALSPMDVAQADTARADAPRGEVPPAEAAQAAAAEADAAPADVAQADVAQADVVQMGSARVATGNAALAALVLSEVRSARLSGGLGILAPRPVIEQSWERLLRRGVDPDRGVDAGLLPPDEVRRRRETSPLRHVLPVLRESLLNAAYAAQHIMVVADDEGRVLWREGSLPVLRKADGLGFEVGADWREDIRLGHGRARALPWRSPGCWSRSSPPSTSSTRTPPGPARAPRSPTRATGG
ncbi:GAF domain-containing protein OS=Streptomyces fumanus OX=67302 GN=GCM10018772_40210 PE=4 SV=1 [Streptomyces fumanus]